jgi:hypothetical protein
MSTYRGGTSLEGLGGPVQMNPYDLGGIDPALEECCQREVESNRRYNALTSTLQRHDVVGMAERRRRNLVTTSGFEGCRCCYDPNSDGGEYRALVEYKFDHPLLYTTTTEQQQQQPNTEKDNNKEVNVDRDTEEDSDDEFDYLLDDVDDFDGDTKALEDQRRAELEYQILCRQVALQHGYGTHRQLHPSRVLQCAGLGLDKTTSTRSPPPAVVLHLVDPDSLASASLDYYLQDGKLAQANPGTVFLRSGGRSTLLLNAAVVAQAFSPALHPERDLPALVAIKDGVVIHTCPNLRGLSADEGGVIEPRAVEQWLYNCGVLLSEAPRFLEELCQIRPEEEALMDYLGQKNMKLRHEEEEAAQRFDCGLEGCSKSFRHEHVGIQTSEQDGLVVKEETILGGQQEKA